MGSEVARPPAERGWKTMLCSNLRMNFPEQEHPLCQVPYAFICLKMSPLWFFVLFSFFGLLVFLGPHLRHMEAPRLGV